ncbi:MAG TPA: ATP-binding cassette domain-containing protein, partial [Deltaproteobacteria bacterium]|nr:ATP-binding cassette domain-containing protein [Deltaproteobacteria bacterium]
MILRAEKLQKSYGKAHIIKGLSILCTPGEVIGLLGPNGAGKTTTFYMVVG